MCVSFDLSLELLLYLAVMKAVLKDDGESEITRKPNRQKRLSPKIHKIVHESGRSTKSLWAKIIERAKK